MWRLVLREFFYAAVAGRAVLRWGYCGNYGWGVAFMPILRRCYPTRECELRVEAAMIVPLWTTVRVWTVPARTSAMSVSGTRMKSASMALVVTEADGSEVASSG